MEIETYVRFLAALALVLALIAVCAWAARRFGLGGSLPSSKGASARLAVIEVKVLDSRRKLVLVRRDASEHLLLLGPNQDLVIEQGAAAPSGDVGTRKFQTPGAGTKPQLGAPK